MPTKDLNGKLTLLARAIEFDGGSFSWFGNREPALPARIVQALPREVLRGHLLEIVQRRLYSDFYCRGRATPLSSRESSPPSAGAGHEDELSAANSGHGYWDDGWVVQTVRLGHLLVRQGGLGISVARKDCHQAPGLEPLAGMTVEVRMPKELRALSPGYYVALSDAPFRVTGESAMVRVYWNLVPPGAASLVKEVTDAFNSAGVPFRLKIVNQPSRYGRCDAGVLYLHQRDYGSARVLLEELYPRMAGWLGEDTNVFTKRLAHGMGLAESPSPAGSFGAHRCGILASALIRAHEERKASLSARLRTIEDAFREQGLSLAAPHLNPGSRDDYDFSPRLRRVAEASAATGRPEGAGSGTGRRVDIDPPPRKRSRQFPDAAAEIGRLLADRATWHDGRCNWMGLTASPDSTAPGPTILAYRSLGPDLYSGTSGVALFLAGLHTVVHDGKVRRTAIGAARQALSRASGSAGLPGFFNGALGVAYAAAQVGSTLGVEELLEGSAALLQSAGIEENGQADLVSGHAGAIVALLMLERISTDLAPPGLAARLGEALLLRAHPRGRLTSTRVSRKRAACSWRSPSSPSTRSLTGLSHGAAGIGWALVELFHATGIARFREGAEMAFNYERDWFDESARNWPDFRGVSGRKKRIGHPLSFQVSWCHGAPGIALSRIRAYEATGDERWKREAVAALETTMAWTRRMMEAGGTNFCLCHGMGGNAHILMEGSKALEFPGGGELCREVAASGISRYARDHQWPLGRLGPRSPGLMCGLSGVGLFYLSLSDPEFQSILLPRLTGRLPQLPEVKVEERNTSQHAATGGAARAFQRPASPLSRYELHE